MCQIKCRCLFTSTNYLVTVSTAIIILYLKVRLITLKQMEEKTTAILVCMYMTWNLFLLLALGHYYTEANFVLKMRNISFYKSLQLLVLLKFKNVCFKNQSLIHSIQQPMKLLNLISAKKIQAYIFKIIIFVFENIL